MNTFTLVHVIISLVAIVSGFFAVAGLLASRLSRVATALFLSTTVLTSLTGFLFPIHGFTPALGTGIVSVAVLALTLYALYGRKLTGRWRTVYVVTAVLALYLNFFVLVVQSFLKIPALNALAPTQKEPPFAIAQAAALVLFVVLGFLAVKRFRPGVPAPA
ncbi:MAG TPA: hypothetical protein VHE13_13215 [Opitutus sp.]|nr:hypothetical protein [Opitutus sp.]